MEMKNNIILIICFLIISCSTRIEINNTKNTINYDIEQLNKIEGEEYSIRLLVKIPTNKMVFEKSSENFMSKVTLDINITVTNTPINCKKRLLSIPPSQ